MAHNKPFIDLHVHSSYSDGALTPEELVKRAMQEGLKAIAIADHDSVAGVPEGIAAGATLGIEVIPAVELSAQFKEWQDIHLLGYGMNHCDSALLEKLDEFRQLRELRNIKILERVNGLLTLENRAEIELGEVLVHTRAAIGRPHIARALLKRGYVQNIEDAFRRYLTSCNVPKCYWAIGDAIDAIKGLGGVTVLAHPTTISIDHRQLRILITELSSLGLDGIEVYNNQAQPDEMEFLRKLAEELQLLITGGSDFHGIEEGLEMGRGRGGIHFNDTLLAPLKKRLVQRQNQLLSL